MKRVILYTTLILLTLFVIIILWQFRLAFLLFFLSLAMAAVFRPPIDFLKSHGVPRILAILLTYISGIGVLVLMLSMSSTAIANELQLASNDFASWYTQIKTVWVTGTQFQQAVAAQLPPLTDLYTAIAGQQAASIFQAVLGFATNTFDTLGHAVIILVMSIYWNVDNERFERLWLSVLPAQYRAHARDIWRDIERGVGNYMRSELIQSLLAVILLYAAYAALNMKYPTLLAILGAIAWLIPWLGALLAVIPPLLVGLSYSPALGFSAAAVTLVVLLIMELVVEPRFFNRRRYSSLLVVLMVIALSDAFGLVGLIIAPPLAAAIQIFFGHFQGQASMPTVVPADTELDNLRQQLYHVQEMAMTMDQTSPQMVNLMQRLEKLINEAGSTIQGV